MDMPFEIVRNDITAMRVDAIVNAAGRSPQVNAGVDLAIHKKAGPQLLQAREQIGHILPGHAAITPAFGLEAKYVIHGVSPHWIDGASQEELLLRQTYDQCLRLALEHGCESVAFPLLASGNNGFSSANAIRIAVNAFSDFLLEHEMYIYLVVFNKESFVLSEKLVQKVTSFIDDHYIDKYNFDIYGGAEDRRPRRRFEEAKPRFKAMQAPTCAAMPSVSLDKFLESKEATFAVTLVELISKSGKKNSEIYKKANVDKKLFSKIVNNVNYHPSKETALSFAIALQLDLAQTQDLIGRAGYTLSHSSKFDLIIEYFIREKNYNIFEINEVLFAFDQVLLGF